MKEEAETTKVWEQIYYENYVSFHLTNEIFWHSK